MTDEAHIYKMAYSQLEATLAEFIDQCYDTHGKPRIPSGAALVKAINCLPADKRPKVSLKGEADVSMG